MHLKNKSVCIIGLGYIGLPTAIIIADSGIKISGYDINRNLVKQINKGLTKINESKIALLLKKTIKNKTFTAATKITPSDIYIITVPTPFVGGSKKPDLSYVNSAAKNIAKVLKKGDLVILESTSPIGTTRNISSFLAKIRLDLRFPHSSNDPDINIAYCPERVIPGNIYYELKNNARIIGGLTKNCACKAKDFYSTFVKSTVDISSSPEVAEMAKLAENSYRDTNIAFANELSIIADKYQINSSELISLINKHPRVNVLNPGPGVGGHCIAVDPWFLYHSFPSGAKLIKKAREVNLHKTEYVINKILKLSKKYPNKKIICCGLTYKPDIDDTRESPSLEIFKSLKKVLGNKVYGEDPWIKASQKNQINQLGVKYLKKCDDILVALVAHKEFLSINPSSSSVMDFACMWSKKLDNK